jgi:hypothetical protein
MSINVWYKERPLAFTIAGLVERGETKRALSLFATLSRSEAEAASSLAERFVELKVISQEEAKILAIAARKMAHFQELDQSFGGERTLWLYAAKCGYWSVLHLLNSATITSGRNVPDENGDFPLNYLLHNKPKLVELLGSSQPQDEHFLAHVWGIGGETRTANGWSFSLEGATTSEIAQRVVDQLSSFIREHPDHQKIEGFQKALRAIQVVEDPLEQKVKRILAGVEPTFIICGWEGHRVVIGINGNRLVKGNRGGCAQETKEGFVRGLRFYNIRRKLDRPTLIRVLEALEAGKRDYFEEGIDKDLNLRPAFQVEAKGSKVGNCTWAAFKLCLRATLLDKGAYKEFTRWVRLKVLADYLDSTEYPNDALLGMIYTKAQLIQA